MDYAEAEMQINRIFQKYTMQRYIYKLKDTQ